MSFKSIFYKEEMTKGEMGSTSRKGFEAKFGYGLQSRSNGAIHDDSGAVAVTVDDGLEQSCWVKMPTELLRDVLMRVEEADSSWPHRKHVMACAGVCRSWRDIVKEIVGTPELSGKLTFPISLKQPGPRDFLIQCFIKRSPTGQAYYLYLGLSQALTDTGKFLLAARKFRRPTYTDYIISLDADNMSRGSGTYIGKLRSNFLGTKFTVYGGMPPHGTVTVSKNRTVHVMGSKKFSSGGPAGSYPVAHIAYELNVLGSRGPRRMQCVMDSIPASAIKPVELAPTHSRFDSFSLAPFSGFKPSCNESSLYEPWSSHEGMLILKNKSPRWHEQLQCWCLNFCGRVTVASVKNFQLVASTEDGQTAQEQEKVLLQFGKVGKDLFTMDYQYPLSAFQAFAICLSSFDTKIACE